jgi:hypothetical protein
MGIESAWSGFAERLLKVPFSGFLQQLQSTIR